MTTEQKPDRWSGRDPYLDRFPDHCCAYYDCPAPIHLSCVATRIALRAADRLLIIGEERFAGFSVEGLHEADWHPDCRASANDTERQTGYWFRHHYSWWSVPLELLEEANGGA